MFNVTAEGTFIRVQATLPELTYKAAAQFKAAFTEVVQSQDELLILLDLSQVIFMDSSGLAAIVYCFRMLSIKERLAICGCTPRVSQLLQLTKVDSLVRIFKDYEEAKTELARTSPQ